MNEIELPAELAESVSTARLPESYEYAIHALAACENIDECKSWSDQAAAIATYARMADDLDLENYAKRIRARAYRRLGELLKAFDGRGGDRSKSETPPSFAPSRAEAARAAGLSKHKTITAVRIAGVPEDEFESLVESARPPGTSILAQMVSIHRTPPADRVDRALTTEDLYAIGRRGDVQRTIQALVTIGRYGETLGVEDIIPALGDENVLSKVQRGLYFAGRIKAALDKAGLRRKPPLKIVE